MPASDPTEILIASDQWATQQILNACALLPVEKFHQRFEMGPGSLHDTLTHMLAALRVWTDILAVREVRPRLEGTQRPLTELQKLADETFAEFAAVARAHPLNEMVSRVRDGKTYTFTRGAVIAHITTHGFHHRAQCLNMLRHLGVKPLPMSSVTEWTLHGEK